jgi:hypothetical protein
MFVIGPPCQQGPVFESNGLKIPHQKDVSAHENFDLNLSYAMQLVAYHAFYVHLNG